MQCTLKVDFECFSDPNSLLRLKSFYSFRFFSRKLSRFATPAESQELLKIAENLIDLNLTYVQRPDLKKDKQNQVGFLLGASGVQAVASIVYSSIQKQGGMKF